MQTIQDRGYVWKKGTALVPTFTAFAVVNLLEQHFPDLVDYAFTARMEDDLDEIAGGHASGAVAARRSASADPAAPTAARQPSHGLKELVDTARTSIDAAAVNTIPIGLDADGAANRGRSPAATGPT